MGNSIKEKEGNSNLQRQNKRRPLPQSISVQRNLHETRLETLHPEVGGNKERGGWRGERGGRAEDRRLSSKKIGEEISLCTKDSGGVWGGRGSRKRSGSRGDREGHDPAKVRRRKRNALAMVEKRKSWAQ